MVRKNANKSQIRLSVKYEGITFRLWDLHTVANSYEAITDEHSLDYEPGKFANLYSTEPNLLVASAPWHVPLSTGVHQCPPNVYSSKHRPDKTKPLPNPPLDFALSAYN